MKAQSRLLIIACCMVLLIVVSALNAQNRDKIELTRTQIQAERQQIVSDYMNLTEQEAKQFWPIYREYRSEIEKINDRMLALVTDYANNYETTTNQKAEEMLKEWQDLQRRKIDIQGNYAGQMLRVIPAKKVLRFFQLENKMDAVVMYELTGAIPLTK